MGIKGLKKLKESGKSSFMSCPVRLKKVIKIYACTNSSFLEIQMEHLKEENKHCTSE